MGNVQTPIKKRRVKFNENVKMDRYQEDMRRFNHIIKIHNTISSDNIARKDLLALLIIKYLERCHGNINMTDEVGHYERVVTVCRIGIETFQETITMKQVHALQKCLIEYCVLGLCPSC